MKPRDSAGKPGKRPYSGRPTGTPHARPQRPTRSAPGGEIDAPRGTGDRRPTAGTKRLTSRDLDRTVEPQTDADSGRAARGGLSRRQDAAMRTSPADAPAAREKFLAGGIRIVFEDADILIVDKPTGIPSVSPPDQETDCVFTEVKKHVRDQVKRRGTRVWVIHRLDKEASGLLVFAKTERAFHWLKEEFRAKRVHRLYSAVVEGQMAEIADEAPTPEGGLARPAKIKQPPMGTIQSFLFEDDRGLVMSVAKPSDSQRGPRRGVQGDDEELGRAAKLAVTHWKVQQAGHGRTLLQVRLETGRKHQIRVHMAEMGYPIVGDRRYKAKTDPIGRVCLHAFELGFTHGTTGKSLRFRSVTPGSFFGLVGGGQDTPVEPMQPAATPPLSEPTPDLEKAPAARVISKSAPLAKQTPDTLSTPASAGKPEASWEHVAEWYDDLLGERGSDHHEEVILPGTMRLLGNPRGTRVLDIACGQGILCRALAKLGAQVVGVDASPSLIASARRLSASPPHGIPEPEFAVGDARELGALGLAPGFDAAACIMAIMNIEPVSPVMRGIAALLKPGAPLVVVMLHPAFRAPGQTSWGWDETSTRKPAAKPDPKSGRQPEAGSQYRRVDGYLSPGVSEIVMNPGGAAKGQKPVTTLTYHRPIQYYVRAMAEAGLLVDAIEEWPSLRQSQPGPRAQAENRARREIPMFLAIRGVRAGA